jgi:hypothetical protein
MLPKALIGARSCVPLKIIMNKIRISLLALLASLPVTYSARAAVETFTAYGVDIIWTNSGAVVWDVNGAPRTPGGAMPDISQVVAVDMDASGKITGSGTTTITYNSTGLPVSRFLVDITGKISSSTTKPTPAVTMVIRGSGYTIDGSGGSTTTLNKLSLKFTGEPGQDPTNPNRLRIVGTLTGTITGPTPLDSRSAKLSGLVAFISNSGSSFTELSTTILQNTKKMLVFDSDWTGSGSIGRTNGFRLQVKGFGQNRGASLSVAGTLGSYTNTIGGNPVGFLAPVSASAKGKTAGQAVTGDATSAEIGAGLITN